MHSHTRGLAFCIAAFAISAAAQTPVTNGNNGVSGAVPVYSGLATLGSGSSSPISVSGSNVGIGTKTPSSALQIVGNITLSQPSGTNNNILMNAISAADLIYFETAGVNQWGILGTNWNGGTNDFEIDRYSNSGAWLGAVMLLQRSSGYVGIGTPSPGAKLEVNGGIKLTSGSGGSITFPDATVQATAWNGVLSGGDYAESVDVAGDRGRYEPGDVLVIDPTVEGSFVLSSKAYSTTVMGIYSTKPGVRGRRQKTDLSQMKDEVPMAMVGIVPTKVSAENGPIHPGDLLVTSSRLGYAMKGTDRSQMLGAVIGKALGHLDSGTGLMEVGVTLQ